MRKETVKPVGRLIVILQGVERDRNFTKRVKKRVVDLILG